MTHELNIPGNLVLIVSFIFVSRAFAHPLNFKGLKFKNFKSAKGTCGPPEVLVS